MKKDFLIISIIFTFFSLYFFTNAKNEGLDHDEAGQFWISKGLNHYSQISERNGGFKDLLVNNNKYNLDPGGFTFVLRVWTLVSNEILWIKFLPFLFFILFCFYIVKTIHLITKKL